MNLPEEEDFLTRRARLATQIARQRQDLVDAYGQLEKPIRYTEYGMRGFGFIRQNPWIMAAVPLVFNMISTAFGWKKEKSSPSLVKSGSKLYLARQVAAAGVRHGWNLYQLYRRVRSIIP